MLKSLILAARYRYSTRPPTHSLSCLIPVSCRERRHKLLFSELHSCSANRTDKSPESKGRQLTGAPASTSRWDEALGAWPELRCPRATSLLAALRRHAPGCGATWAGQNRARCARPVRVWRPPHVRPPTPAAGGPPPWHKVGLAVSRCALAMAGLLGQQSALDLRDILQMAQRGRGALCALGRPC